MRLIDADALKKDDELTEWRTRDTIRTGKMLKAFSELFVKKIDDAPTVNAVSEEVYTREYNLRKDAEFKVYKLEKALEQKPFDIETYCKEHFMVMVDKDVWEKAEKALKQESCEDDISRQAVYELVRSLTRWCVRSEDGKLNNVGLLYDDVMFGVSKIPSVKLQEPKTGYWIVQDIHNCHTDFKCSECGYIHSFMHLYGKPTADYTYCPNCGAKMEGEV